MKSKELKTKALETLKHNWSMIVVITLIAYGIVGMISTMVEIFMVGGFAVWVETDILPWNVSMVVMVIDILVLPIYFAYYGIHLDMIKGRNFEIGDVFELYHSDSWMKAIGIQIVLGIFVMLWALLLIIPGIIKGIAYSQTYFIYKEKPDLTVMEILNESERLMKGYKMKYFVLNLSFLGWNILALFTGGIGYLWLLPYMVNTYAHFYEEVKSKSLT